MNKRRFRPLPTGRSLAMVTAVVAVLALGTPAQAGPISFSTNGLGVANAQVGTFDENPGNALAVGAQSAINAAIASLATAPPGSSATTTPFTVYYQANLTLLDPMGHQIASPGFTFSAVAKFTETATVYKDASGTVNFTLAANQTGSYLDFFAHTTGMIGNNITGMGFATDDPNARLIYSGALMPGAPSGTYVNVGGSVKLDSYPSTGEPNYAQQSVTGFGGSQLTATTTFVNTSYFTSGDPGTQTFTTTNSTPFTTVDPSQAFVNLNASSTAVLGYLAPALGAVNGSATNGGPDFQFQADASSSFNPTAAVPEPASLILTLTGLGFGGIVASRRRRRASAH